MHGPYCLSSVNNQLILWQSWLARHNPIFQTRTLISEISRPFLHSLLIQLPGAPLDPLNLFLLQFSTTQRSTHAWADWKSDCIPMAASPQPIPCLGLCRLLPIEPIGWVWIKLSWWCQEVMGCVTSFPSPGRALSVFSHYHLRWVTCGEVSVGSPQDKSGAAPHLHLLMSRPGRPQDARLPDTHPRVEGTC